MGAPFAAKVANGSTMQRCCHGLTCATQCEANSATDWLATIAVFIQIQRDKLTHSFIH
jgi:hypothetical protein